MFGIVWSFYIRSFMAEYDYNIYLAVLGAFVYFISVIAIGVVWYFRSDVLREHLILTYIHVFAACPLTVLLVIQYFGN